MDVKLLKLLIIFGLWAVCSYPSLVESDSQLSTVECSVEFDMADYDWSDDLGGDPPCTPSAASGTVQNKRSLKSISISSIVAAAQYVLSLKRYIVFSSLKVDC